MSKHDLIADITRNAIKFGPAVIHVVKGIKGLFGKGKSGAEKKANAKDILKEIELVSEGLAGKDLFNGTAAEALLDEAVELGYQAMKIEERLDAIKAELKALRPQPPILGPGNPDAHQTNEGQ